MVAVEQANAVLLNGAGLFPQPPEHKPGEGVAQQSQVVGSGTPGGGGRGDVSPLAANHGNNTPVHANAWIAELSPSALSVNTEAGLGTPVPARADLYCGSIRY
jgi:hypothetical protein